MGISLIGLSSCTTNENVAATSKQEMKPEAMKRFEQSLKDLLKPENRPTEEERKNSTSMQLSDRRKDLLLPAAKDLIKSTGISDAQLSRETGNDRDKILNWGMKIYNENYAKVNQAYKYQN